MNRFSKVFFSAALAALMVWGVVRAAEVTDLNINDASNTGTAANAGFPENMPPSDVNNAARALEGMIRRWYGDISFMVTTGGAANALSATAERTISSYAAGQVFGLSVAFANTGNTTLTVDGVGAKNILKNHDTALASGDLEVGQFIYVAYDAAQDAFQLLSTTAQAGAGDLLAANNLSDVGSAETSRDNLGVGYGAHTIWIPAGAMVARTSTGMASATSEITANRVMLTLFDADSSTDEFVTANVRMPKSWDAGQLTASFSWLSTNTTGVVVWGIQCLTVGDTDSLTTAFGTAQTTSDTSTAIDTIHHSANTTSSIDCANTEADEDVVIFQIFRDADDSGDTSLVDARLFGVRILYEVTAGNDD